MADPDDVSGASDPNAASVYMEDGPDGPRAVYRASALLSCQNLLLMARLGYDGASPPADTQARYDEGHEQEPIIIGKLESYGTRVYDRQGTVDLPVGKKAIVRGHIDGLAADEIYVTSINGVVLPEPTTLQVNGLVIVDAKGLSEKAFEKWQKGYWHSFEYYRWQQFIYILGYGAVGVLMAVKDKNSGKYTFDYWERDAMGLSKTDIVKRVMLIEGMAGRGETALFESQCSPKTFPCPYFMFHPATEKTKTDDGASLDVDTSKVIELGQRRAAVDAQMKELQKEKEDLDAAVVEAFGGMLVSVTASDLTITTYHAKYSTPDWVEIANVMGLDVDSAKSQYTISQESPKTTVKVTPKRKRK